jgi:hypothetical protein
MLELRTVTTVGNVGSNDDDGHSDREGHRTTKTWQAEDVTQRAHEPEWYEIKQDILSPFSAHNLGEKLGQTSMNRETPSMVDFVHELGA